MTQLSSHFSLAELTRSEVALRKGLDNTPTREALEALYETAARLEEVRALLDCRMFISSGYRSPNVNSAIGGAVTSQHVKGEAADFTAPDYGSPRVVCRAIMNSEIEFDQLIAEGGDNGWIHISFSDAPRHSVLTATFKNGKVTYTQGIV